MSGIPPFCKWRQTFLDWLCEKTENEKGVTSSLYCMYAIIESNQAGILSVIELLPHGKHIHAQKPQRIDRKWCKKIDVIYLSGKQEGLGGLVIQE